MRHFTVQTKQRPVKTLLIALSLLAFSPFCSGQIVPDVENVKKYPDELVSDRSLMNYTIYKPYTKIGCSFKMRQVSKTSQRTVFVNEDETIKMSFAFFDAGKLPFLNVEDRGMESAYKFFVFDSIARVKAKQPPITVFKNDTTNGIIYYREAGQQKSNVYLVGTTGNIISLILFSAIGEDAINYLGEMHMSYKLNLKD
ncbi:MAG: hypothetical protein EOO13_08830 [Chitinophagaceae bacterium]|nr:MAG: hypothetical protein EOO13_08830 [Chitinophagaceae bacterium]